jgi:hypothetical protein
MAVNLNGFGYLESADVTAAKTLSSADIGFVQNVKVSQNVTLPAAAAGLSYIIRVGAPGLTFSVLPNGTDTVSGYGFTAAASKGAVLTNQPAGSWLKLAAQTGNWNITELSGAPTRTP